MRNGTQVQCSLSEDIWPPKNSQVVSFSLNRDGLKNWISRLGLESAEPYKIGLFGTFSYFAEVGTNLILPPLSDKHGRRYFTLFGSLL